MGFFTLTKKQITLLGTLLGLSLALIVFHTLSQSSWNTLFGDHNTADIYELEQAQVITEFPIQDATVAKVLHRIPLENITSVAIYNEWKLPLFQNPSLKWSEQLRIKLQEKYPQTNTQNLRLAFYIDLDPTRLSQIDKPTLFFGHITGQWDLYANNTILARGDDLVRYPNIRLPNKDKQRLTWVIINKKVGDIDGPTLTHGLSIRSAEEAAWAQRTLPMQKQLPRLISCVVFFCLALFSAILAYSAPRYNDLWALAAFCGSMFFVIWINTPFYWEAYVAEGDNGDRYNLVLLVARLFLTVAGAALTLSFFRVRGYFLWLILVLTITWSAWLVFEHMPTRNIGTPYAQLRAASNAKFVIALLSSQLITFAYGYYSLIEQYRKFKASGLIAMLRPMKRRFAEAAIYTIGMGIMLAAYLKGMPLQSQTTGPDLFLLFALVPALVVFTQFYWMMGAGTRFREKLVPQFDYVDYLVMELRDKALRDTYDGVLAAFDLKGFKKLMGLKLKSPAHAEAVQLLLTRIKADLDILITTGRTVFRYKSNGDEWIYTLYAKDKNHAHTLLKDVVHSWQMQGTGLLNQWKTLLRDHLGPHAAVDDAQDVLRALELHVMFCLLENMTINAEGGVARPDYSCDSLTFLSPAFKHAAHNRVAMYATEAELVLPLLALGSHYEVLEEKPFAIGFY